MPTETIIDLLRHGECEGGEIYRGSTDVALSQTGWQQMHSSASMVAPQWQHIVSSPMQRCAKFAAELAQQHQRELSHHHDLAETFFGDWEGRLIKDVWSQDTQRVSAWAANPRDNSPPNGEPTAAFMARVSGAFDSLAQQFQHQHIGLVIHGGVMRVILAHILNTPFNGFSTIDVPYACLSRIKIFHTERGEFRQLVFHNQTTS